MANRTTDKVEQLKKRRDVISARIQKIEARQATKERKQETRRKILVGAYYLDKAKKEEKMDEIKKMMGGYLTRNSDRVLFDLDALDNE